MIIKLKNGATFNSITDNSKQCNKTTAFILTHQNRNYIDSVTCKVITPADCLDILGIKKSIKIIGVTGTNGKTTTAAAIYSILLDLDKKVAFQGTRGYFVNEERRGEKSLTTPPILQTIANLKDAQSDGCEYFIMEVSSHAIKQKRIEGLEFYLKIFTNITQDHLDYHGNIDSYVSVKSSFFDDETLKLINKDDKKIRFNKKNCVTYGVENPSTYKVVAYTLKDGTSAVLQKIDKTYNFYSPLHGLFNIYNILAALSAVDMLQIVPLKETCKAIENFAGVEGRMEIVSSKPLVIVDFAHTPDGMDKVFDAFKDRDIIVVFGAGGDRDRDKREKMGNIANKYAKKIVLTSDNPRGENPNLIIKDIAVGIKNTDSLYIEVDRKEAIKYALHVRCDHEIVLILGKGDETYQEFKEKKIPFDDRNIVRELLKIQSF
ncbi:MAG: UDP-N-acetylmuramoyl-L-alanyl-D-glutamate--2,6-diaminopimelate ligase [Sulfurospirillum sp.]|nr:UDP-N-acetylmuramoyl-L-alanyl-D-glutamate--2,6-diaminopimelate ligase [Sulfurospirillum sp.]MBL0702782.1 UDP-N-acetylmuramoyl-L-alanyl-D-glutamate--2,6-diaminopimelate ligase [Sulfurospirillum sp.]